MGCETSELLKQGEEDATESDVTGQDIYFRTQNIIDRQRGDVMELYHFSRVVYRGRSLIRRVLERNSRIERVCKILPLGKKISLLRSFQEVEVLKNLHHPNIVQVIEYFNKHDSLYIMMELLQGFTIQQFMFQQQPRTLDLIVDIVKQLLIAINFMQQKGYAHLGIVPKHIILTPIDKTQLYLVKLVGFGQAMKEGANQLQAPSHHPDSLFRPPEATLPAQLHKQDVWAVGIILLQLISGERKFPEFRKNRTQIITDIIGKQSLPSQKNSAFINLLEGMLSQEPEQRLSASDALKHQVFQISWGEHVIAEQNQQEVMQRLMQYRVENSLKSLFSTYASINLLTLEEKTQHLLEFYNFDKNKDGMIDFEELAESFQNTFHLDQKEAKERVTDIFARQSKRHDQSLEFHDFLAATALASEAVRDRAMVKLFQQLDVNKDGAINREELGRSIEGVSSTLFLRSINRDKITLGEFRQLMERMFEEQKQ